MARVNAAPYRYCGEAPNERPYSMQGTMHRYGPRSHRFAPIGGRGAARMAAGVGRYVRRFADSRRPDDIYDAAAGILGLYGVAFYGDAATAAERRKLRDAWREALAIAALHGTNGTAWARRIPGTLED